MRLYAYSRSSASYRVRIALHHKRLAFELAPVAIDRREQEEPAHLARNPLGQVPVLEIQHDGARVQLAQSLAILEYLEERYPQPPLLPSDPLARGRARELAELVNSGIQPLQNSGVLRYIREELKGDDLGWCRRVIRRGLEAFAERARTSAGRFSVGDEPTLADVCLVPQLYNARHVGASLEGLDALVAIDERCRALPRWELAAPERQPDYEPERPR